MRDYRFPLWFLSVISFTDFLITVNPRKWAAAIFMIVCISLLVMLTQPNYKLLMSRSVAYYRKCGKCLSDICTIWMVMLCGDCHPATFSSVQSLCIVVQRIVFLLSNISAFLYGMMFVYLVSFCLTETSTFMGYRLMCYVGFHSCTRFPVHTTSAVSCTDHVLYGTVWYD